MGEVLSVSKSVRTSIYHEVVVVDDMVLMWEEVQGLLSIEENLPDSSIEVMVDDFSDTAIISVSVTENYFSFIKVGLIVSRGLAERTMLSP